MSASVPCKRVRVTLNGMSSVEKPLVQICMRETVYDAYATLVSNYAMLRDTYKKLTYELIVHRFDPESGNEVALQSKILDGYKAVKRELETIMAKCSIYLDSPHGYSMRFYGLDNTTRYVGNVESFLPIYDIYALFVIDSALVHHTQYTRFQLLARDHGNTIAFDVLETFTEMRNLLTQRMDNSIE